MTERNDKSEKYFDYNLAQFLKVSWAGQRPAHLFQSRDPTQITSESFYLNSRREQLLSASGKIRSKNLYGSNYLIFKSDRRSARLKFDLELLHWYSKRPIFDYLRRYFYILTENVLTNSFSINYTAHVWTDKCTDRSGQASAHCDFITWRLQSGLPRFESMQKILKKRKFRNLPICLD